MALPIDLEVKVERLRRTISKYPAHEKWKIFTCPALYKKWLKYKTALQIPHFPLKTTHQVDWSCPNSPTLSSLVPAFIDDSEHVFDTYVLYHVIPFPSGACLKKIISFKYPFSLFLKYQINFPPSNRWPGRDIRKPLHIVCFYIRKLQRKKLSYFSGNRHKRRIDCTKHGCYSTGWSLAWLRTTKLKPNPLTTLAAIVIL